MASNTVDRRTSVNTASPCLLLGLIFDETGDRLSPSHAIKDGVRYRYYISHRLMQARRKGTDGWRVPATAIERSVISIVTRHLNDELKLAKLLDLDCLSPDAHRNAFARSEGISAQLNTASPVEHKKLLQEIRHRVELHPGKLIIEIDPAKLRSVLEIDARDLQTSNPSQRYYRIEVSHELKRRGVETKIIIGEGERHESTPDPHLIMTIAKAHRWLNLLTEGSVTSINELAQSEQVDRNEVSRFLPLAFLAPDIVEKILAGKQPIDLTYERLRRMPPLSSSWKEQREHLGFTP